MTGVRILTVGIDEGESRLDRWLKKRLPEVTQGAIEKWCRTGQIRVDGGRVAEVRWLTRGCPPAIATRRRCRHLRKTIFRLRR